MTNAVAGRGGDSLVILTIGLGRGGAEEQLTKLALHWRRCGRRVQVVVLSSIEDPGHRRRLDDAGIPVTHLGLRSPANLLAVIYRLVRLLRREKPATLLSFMIHANLLGRIAGRAAGVPRVVSSIRNEYFGGRIRELLMRLSAALDHKTTTNSALAARSLVGRGIVPGHKMDVIPNALSSDFVRSDPEDGNLRREIGLPQEGFMWLTVGSLTPQKNHEGLLRAFACLEPEAHLVLAGVGPLRARLEELALDLGVAARVVLLGERTDVAALMAVADGFALASAWEGSPNVVIEAMASGLTVVATAVGGVPDLVRDGDTGFLTPAGDHKALAERMRKVAAMDDGARRRIGRAARDATLADHDPDAVMARWEEVLFATRESSR